MKQFYSLAIVAMIASTTVQAQTVILDENFNEFTNQGGNDGQWGGALDNPPLLEHKDWTLVKAYKGSGAIKLGTTKLQGSATTPALEGLKGNATLTFRAGAWNTGSEQTTLLLEITGGGTLDMSQVTLVKAEFSSYTVKIADGTEATKITFKGAGDTNARFFLDDVKVETEKLGIADYEKEAKALQNTVWTNVASFSAKGKSTVEIYNLNGQLVKSFAIEGSQNVNVSDLAKGVYLVKTTNAGVTSTAKVVKK